MKNQKFLKLFTFLSVLSLSAIAKPTHADIGDVLEGAGDLLEDGLGLLGAIGGGLGGALLSAIATVLGLLSNLISWILFDLILEPILGLVLRNANLLIEHQIAQNIWEGALTVANGLFLLALIIASVAIILSSKSFNPFSLVLALAAK